MQLYEKYRPKTLADFVGQDKIKKQISHLLRRDEWDRDALLITGPSGTGKTSLGWIIAEHVADELFITELDGDKCNVAAVHELEYSLCLTTPNGKWRVVIVNECHAMSKQAVQAWLTLLERLPKHALVIFTTTETIQTDLFGNFSEPFARRCKVYQFSNQGLCQAMAERAQQIAERENLDGKPLQSYIRLVQTCHNNMGRVLQEIDKGEML